MIVIKNRHKWNGAFIGTRPDSGIASCVKCGCIKQFVNGYPTYFIDDTVYIKKAMPCDNRLIKGKDIETN